MGYRTDRPKRKRITRVAVFLTILFIFSVGLGWGTAAVVDLVKVLDQVSDNGERGTDLDALWSTNLPQRINVMIIGEDTRPGETRARSDALMVASLDRVTGRIAVISIPRDTRIKIPGYGINKINAAYALGGPQLTRRVVEPLLGVEIPYYVATDFNGFKGIIDTLGGVTINVERSMYKPEEEINIKPGLQRLNGKDALGFVRYRTLPLGDIDRVSNQKKFLLALADEMFQVKTVTRLPQLIPQIQNCLKTNFTAGEMLDLAQLAVKFNPDEMVVGTLPGNFLEASGSYWLVNENVAKGLLDRLMEPGAKAPEFQPATLVMGPEEGAKPVPKPTEDTSQSEESKATPPSGASTDGKDATGSKSKDNPAPNSSQSNDKSDKSSGSTTSKQPSTSKSGSGSTSTPSTTSDKDKTDNNTAVPGKNSKTSPSTNSEDNATESTEPSDTDKASSGKKKPSTPPSTLS